uniref:Uncharacterized protein n=1 Tax=Nelumbo nucifera TaxID=4432 RepID=A0A822YGZ9_NELNU|nr:TPA_asm: hypothetical protein HUJ06_031733 [Nelumbo nucifera]
MIEFIGNQYFAELRHRCFFQEGISPWPSKRDFRMHDLIHDLSQFVSRGMCFRMEGVNSCNLMNKVRHMSLVIEDLESININEFDKCLQLSTFILIDYFLKDIDDKFHGNLPPAHFFGVFKFLRVLDLNSTRIETLPDISHLKHFRYINLSCSDIRELPEPLCYLFNLQTLILDDCLCLSGLPKSIGNLINLQHLRMAEIGDSKFEYTPRGIWETAFA